MRRKNRRIRSARSKIKLGLPELEYVKTTVLNSLRSLESQRSYRRLVTHCVEKLGVKTIFEETHPDQEKLCPSIASRLAKELDVPWETLGVGERAKLQNEILTPTCVDYLTNRLAEELRKRSIATEATRDVARLRKQHVGKELTNLVQAVANGAEFQSVREAMRAREEELRELNIKLRSVLPNCDRPGAPALRNFVEGKVGNLRELLSKHNHAEARMELAKHVTKIVIHPGERGEIIYQGEWRVLGDGGNMGGAEGQNRTGYAGLFRAALYQ